MPSEQQLRRDKRGKMSRYALCGSEYKISKAKCCNTEAGYQLISIVNAIHHNLDFVSLRTA